VNAINLVNVGYKHQFRPDLSGIVTLSDIFNGQVFRRFVDTATLTDAYQREQVAALSRSASSTPSERLRGANPQALSTINSRWACCAGGDVVPRRASQAGGCAVAATAIGILRGINSSRSTTYPLRFAIAFSMTSWRN
jgi:hypothetical protein